MPLFHINQFVSSYEQLTAIQQFYFRISYCTGSNFNQTDQSFDSSLTSFKGKLQTLEVHSIFFPKNKNISSELNSHKIQVQILRGGVRANDVKANLLNQLVIIQEEMYQMNYLLRGILIFRKVKTVTFSKKQHLQKVIKLPFNRNFLVYKKNHKNQKCKLAINESDSSHF